MLTPENGDREKVKNVVIIITDGKSQDDVQEPSRILRETGALVRYDRVKSRPVVLNQSCNRGLMGLYIFNP